MQSVALMLKRAFWAIFLCLAISSFPLPSLAVTLNYKANVNPLLLMEVGEVLNQGALGAIILGVAAFIMMAFRPTVVKPGGRSRTQGPEKTRVLNCANCRQPMEKLDSESVQPYLSQTEQVAQKIGSLSFEGWRCPRCQPKLTGQDIHVCAYVLDRFRYGTCPTCQEWTVERTPKILELATKDKEGERLVTALF